MVGSGDVGGDMDGLRDVCRCMQGLGDVGGDMIVKGDVGGDTDGWVMLVDLYGIWCGFGV